MSTALPQPGELFEGRFRIDQQIGVGGFSKVFRARDESLGVDVALKILVSLDDVPGNSSKKSQQGDLANRFLREARILSQLKSDNSIKLFHSGQTPTGVLYMAFEFVKGPSLFEMIRDHGAQSAEFLVHVLEGTLRSLEDAHHQGLLHRDIKPNNLMLAEQPGGKSIVKVLDFGIAKAYGEAAGMVPGNDLTAAGTIVGTPRYMPPELLRGKPLSPGSDLYSLGIVSIEVLTGQKAIQGKDRLIVIQRQISAEPIPLPPHVQIPQRLRDIVERLVQKEPHLRYGSASEVLRDLKNWNSVPDSPPTEPITIPEEGEERTIATTINIAELHAAQADAADDATVLKTVNTADLSRAMAAAQQGPELDSTRSAPALTADIVDGLVPTQERAALAPPSNWPPPSNTPASGSGNFPTASASGNYPTASGSGAFRSASASGNFQTAGDFQSSGDSDQIVVQHGTPDSGWDTSGGASLSARTEMKVSQSQSFPAATGNFELTGGQKALLAVSFVLPGIAHIGFGQTKRGAAFFAVFVLTAGIAIIGSLAVVFDAYLVLRAQQYRKVGDWEFFPDYKQFFG